MATPTPKYKEHKHKRSRNAACGRGEQECTWTLKNLATRPLIATLTGLLSLKAEKAFETLTEVGCFPFKTVFFGLPT